MSLPARVSSNASPPVFEIDELASCFDVSDGREKKQPKEMAVHDRRRDKHRRKGCGKTVEEVKKRQTKRKDANVETSTSMLLFSLETLPTTSPVSRC
jgi:hypothetical protein